MSVIGDPIVVAVSSSKANSTSIADEYSASSVYAVGDLVVYKANIYKCATAITEPEAWNPAHWTLTTVEAEISKGDEDIADLYDKKADKTVLSFVDRRVKYIYEKQNGQEWDVEDDSTAAYSKTVPVGGLSVDTASIGGNSVVNNQLIDTTKDVTESGENYSVNVSNASSALVQSIGGKSVVWNQISKQAKDWSRNFGSSIVSFTDDEIIVENPQNGTYAYNGSVNIPIEGHKYLVLVWSKKENDCTCGIYLKLQSGGSPVQSYATNDYSLLKAIDTCIGATSFEYNFQLRCFRTGTGKIYFKLPAIVDLTQTFGHGNEPTELTDPRILAIEAYLTDHPEYNAGELISADCDAVISIGRNLWDEQWDKCYYRVANGEKTSASDCIGCKNLIPVLPSTDYYFLTPNNNVNQLLFYDSNGVYTGNHNKYNGPFTTPSNAHYMTFYLLANYGTTYNNDVSIYEGSSALPYTPYMKSQFDIPEQLIEDHPLRSAGDVYDEYDFKRKKFIKRVGSYAFTGNENWELHSSSTESSKRWWITGANFTSIFNDITTDLPESIVTSKVIVNNYAWSLFSNSQIGTFSMNKNGSNNWILFNTTYPNIADFRTAISNTIIYYELATPVETDISSYFSADFKPQLPVESGGTVTFEQTDSEFSVPNTITWAKTAWSQPLDSSHKYLISDNGTASIATGISTYNVVGAEDYIVDLTKFFGGNTAILNSIVTAEDAYAYGVPRERGAYNEGELISADCEEVVSEGKNLFDKDSATLNMRVISTTGVISSATGLFVTDYIPINGGDVLTITGVNTLSSGTSHLCAFYDDEKTYISGYTIDDNVNIHTVTAPTNAKYVVFNGSNGKINNTQIEKGSSSSSYAPYVGTLGTIDIPSALRTAHPLRSAGDVHDEYDFERMKFVQRIGVVDLGTLTYYYDASVPRFRGAFAGVKTGDKTKLMCAKYTPVNLLESFMDKTIRYYLDYTRFEIHDDDYTDAALFKAAMDGVMVYYELSEPVETDISSYFPAGFDTLLNTEPGGSVTFEQTDDTELPVPNTQSWLINVPDAASA